MFGGTADSPGDFVVDLPALLTLSLAVQVLTLHDLDWQRLNADRAAGRGRFEIAIQPRRGNSSRHAAGTVVLDVITPPSGPPVLARLPFEDDLR
mgnify:CR=1 FL=1